MSYCLNCNCLLDFQDPEVIAFYEDVTSLDGVRCCHCLELWDFNFYTKAIPNKLRRQVSEFKQHTLVNLVMSTLHNIVDNYFDSVPPVTVIPQFSSSSSSSSIEEEKEDEEKKESRFKLLEDKYVLNICNECLHDYRTLPTVSIKNNDVIIFSNTVDKYICPNCKATIVNRQLFDTTNLSNFYYAITAGVPKLGFNLLANPKQISTLLWNAITHESWYGYNDFYYHLYCEISKFVVKKMKQFELKQLRILFMTTARTYADKVNMRLYLNTLELKYKVKLNGNNLKFLLPKNTQEDEGPLSEINTKQPRSE